MSEYNPLEIGQQLRKPDGELGLKVADKMNVTNKSIYDFVLSFTQFHNNDNLLEIGFGNGKLISKFFELNPTIAMCGVDFSELMCQEAIIANKKLVDEGKLKITCEDISNLSFTDEQFDKIITINTVYFWNPFETNLLEIKRVLKTGGQLIIGYRPKEGMSKSSFTTEVFTLYTRQELTDLVINHGFKIITDEVQPATIKTIDGQIVDIEDICLIVEKL